MSDKTAGSSGRALKSLFGTLVSGGNAKPAELAAGDESSAANTAALPADTNPLVFDGVRTAGLPRVLPAGTVIVVNPTHSAEPAPVAAVTAAPVAVLAPVYDFNSSPGPLIVAAPVATPNSGLTRTYDFPAPEPVAGELAGGPALAASAAAIAANVTGSAQPPSRPTLVVPATIAAGATASVDTAQIAVQANVLSAGDPDLALPPSPSIPTPPSVSSSSPSVAGLGTGIAITDILRLAAQLSAERIAPTVPMLAKKNAITVDDERVKELRDRLIKDIDSLYQKTIETVGDSPGVVAYCLDLLKKARLALLTGSTAEDLSQAEFYIEEVRSKLSRSRDPIPAGEMLNVVGLLIWTVAFWVLCLPLALLPWFAPTGVISYWNLKIPVELIPLLATVGWGGTGGVIGALYNITWFVQMREYDPAYNLDYFLRPIKGFIAGGVMMLIFTAGIATLNGPQAALGADKASLSFALVYLGAALAGFKQEYVYEWFDSILKVFFRAPTTPKQLDANAK